MKNLRIISAGLLMAIASTSMGQVTISTSQLNGTKWKIKGDTSGDMEEFTMNQNIVRHKDNSFFSYPYYLTNVPITSYKGSAFDRSKVDSTLKSRTIRSLLILH